MLNYRIFTAQTDRYGRIIPGTWVELHMTAREAWGARVLHNRAARIAREYWRSQCREWMKPEVRIMKIL